MNEEEVTRIAKEKADDVGCGLTIVFLLTIVLLAITWAHLGYLEKRVKALESAAPAAK